MHWVLQNDLFKESEWANLTSSLEAFGVPYSVHKVVPFVGELVPPARPLSNKVVCFGSYSMRHTAKAQGWTPGVYDLFEQTFIEQFRHWGHRMLNSDSVITEFQNVRLPEPKFIRPIDDSKYFAGKVFEPAEFEEWRVKVCDLKEDYGTSLTATTLVQVCEYKEIYAEYRYWVVDGKIVTKSLYKRGTKVMYSGEVDDRFDQFVAEATSDEYVGSWQPHRAFVIDVCDTPDGIKIVEINTINAAGFYAGDVQKLVAALEELEA